MGYNLVSFEADNRSLLFYSESRKLVRYAFWDDGDQNREKIFLYNKTIWTDSNIMLSNLRNQLVSFFLKNYPAHYEWKYGNLHGEFFRGKLIDCIRMLDAYRITYRFTLNTLIVGLLRNPAFPVEPIDGIPGELLSENWVFRKKYNYSNLNSFEQIPVFFAGIEQELFSSDHPAALPALLGIVNQALAVKIQSSEQQSRKATDAVN